MIRCRTPSGIFFRQILNGTGLVLWAMVLTAAAADAVTAREDGYSRVEQALFQPDSEAEASHTFGLSAGAGLGSFIFGGSIKHDFAFVNVHYGRVLPGRIGADSWWEGRWLILGEATVGRETSPGDAWSASLAPVARYLFGYPGAVVPFLEAGFGLTWTDIGEPDLGGELQFNSQGGGGIYWFTRPDLALTLQYRFVHYSNAGLRRPNGGVNIHSALLGVSYFF